MVTRDELLDLVHYDSEAGTFTWKVRRCGTKGIGMPAGGHDSKGYSRIKINGKHYLSHRLAWLYVYGRWPDDMIDHINGVRDDNRIHNLREATNIENCRNQSRRRSNTSGIKGVSWDKSEGKWKAYCVMNGKFCNLGYYTRISDAEEAVKNFREKNHGEFTNHGY